MVLPLPYVLLLFALDDTKGTLHSASFLAVDHALRGAALAELKLRGILQARASGEIRWRPSGPRPPAGDMLASVVDALAQVPSPAPAKAWFDALARHLPKLREALTQDLRDAGILGVQDQDGGGVLPDRVAHPLADGGAEDRLVELVRASLASGDDIAPRMGILVGLVAASHLDKVVFADQADTARARADWVHDRDIILRTTREAIAEAEGF